MRLNSLEKMPEKPTLFVKSKLQSCLSSSKHVKKNATNKSLQKSYDLTTSPFLRKKLFPKKILNNLDDKIKSTTKQSSKKPLELDKSSPKQTIKLAKSFSSQQLEDYQQFREKLPPAIKASNIIIRLDQCSDNQSRIKLLSNIITEIGQKDAQYKSIFNLIVKEYESHLDNLKAVIKEQDNKISILEQSKFYLSKELRNHIDLYKKLLKEHKLLFNKYIKLSNNMLITSKYDIANLERTDENWNKIISQNVKLDNTLEVFEDELKYYKSENKKVKAIVNNLEKKMIYIRKMYYKNDIDIKLPMNIEDDYALDDIDKEGTTLNEIRLRKGDTNIPILNIP